MMLEKKAALVYGAGAIGTAVARAFAREGATVFLAGRTLATVEAAAESIRSIATAPVYAAQIDVLDEQSVEEHADRVLQAVPRIDVSFNAVGHDHHLGNDLVSLSPRQFVDPLAERMLGQFLTARAAAKRMAEQGSGVIMMITATPARMPVPRMTSFAPGCAATEALARTLAAEVGPRGVRVVCLRSAGSPDSPGLQLAFAAQAEAAGTTPESIQQSIEDTIMLRRMPLLGEVADMAAVIASDRATAMTATVVNLSCASIPD